MIDEIVSAYTKVFPEERSNLAQLIEQVTHEDNLNNRKTLPGHITGSAIVLTPKRDKVLLIHHKVLDIWIQPGGHWDPEEPDPWTAARREAVEETGVQIEKQLPVANDDTKIPLDINTHQIPENLLKSEPAHLHHDFRYVFLAAEEKLVAQEAEVIDTVFVVLDDPRATRVQPLIAKLRRFGIV